MGKPGGGGGGGGLTLFTTNIIGPPPGPINASGSEWIDLGLIPTGYRIWLGNAQYSAITKSITFELRTNNATKSAGNTTDTALLASAAASPRSGTVNSDMYKGGTLHIVTVNGTGVEHWWLRLTSKVTTPGAYIYSINYTTE